MKKNLEHGATRRDGFDFFGPAMEWLNHWPRLGKVKSDNYQCLLSWIL